MSAPDIKPSILSSSHVTIKIKSQDDISVYFRIKKDIELRKVMEAFSTKIGVDMSSLKFHVDGIRVKPNQTPNELELEDGDEIDAFGYQYAGFGFYHLN